MDARMQAGAERAVQPARTQLGDVGSPGVTRDGEC